MRGLPADRELLTARCLEVLRLAANGHTNAEIAKELFISEEAVKSHMQLAYRSLGARDRAHAVAICLVRGLIHPHEIELCPPRTRPATAAKTAPGPGRPARTAPAQATTPAVPLSAARRPPGTRTPGTRRPGPDAAVEVS